MPSDLLDQAPQHIRDELKPGDHITMLKHLPVKKPAQLYDPEAMWLQFCGVDSPEKIGQAGPPIASGFIPGYEKDGGQGKFRVPFGRDSWYMSWDMKEIHRELMAATHKFHNEHLGLKDEVFSEIQYGRDFHEYRDPATDELAQQLTRERHWQWVPNGGFYAEVDVPALNVRALHWCHHNLLRQFDYLYETYKGLDGDIYTNFEALQIRMSWLLRKTSSNPEGFIGYRPAFEGSHENQTMEDSPTSHMHEDGTLANSKQEVYSTYAQADLYEAYLCAAEIYEYVAAHEKRSDLLLEAQMFRLRAMRLKEVFFNVFWNQGQGFLAVGADRDENGTIRTLWDKKAIPAFSLDTRIWKNIPRSWLQKYVSTLFAPDMFAAAGFRTRSSNSKGYNRDKYHGGASWPFITAKIADGLLFQGFKDEARVAYQCVTRVVEETNMWPELVSGSQDSIEMIQYDISIHNERLQMEESISSPSQYTQGWTYTAWRKALYRLERM
jgi:glycogen debranching enzyme